MLISIGITPVGMGETDPYRVWVGAPALPPGIVDVGIRNEPNLEALAALRPDLILVSPLSRPIVPLIEAIAPVREIAIYTPERAPIDRLRRELLALGAEFGRSREADAVLAGADALFGRLRARLAAWSRRPLLVMNLLDGRHARVFGPGSLFDDVLARLGLSNAWSEPGNVWGFSLAGVEALAAFPDATMVVVAPVPPGIDLAAGRATLWSNLPAVRRGHVVALPASWLFGDLVAATRFATFLADALDPAGAARAGG